MRWFTTVVALLILSSTCVLAGTTWEDQLGGKWKLLHVANGQISIGIAPELGGRLLDFRLNRAGSNLLDNGGLAAIAPDAGAPWPVATCSVGIDASSISGTATADGIDYQQQMALAGESTTLRVEVTLTNRRKHAIDLPRRLTSSWRVGPDGTTFIDEIDGKLRRRVVKDGTPGDAGFFHEAEVSPWVALVDTEDAVIHLVRYPAAGGYIPLVWQGAGARDFPGNTPPAGPDQGFLRLDNTAPAVETAPGESVSWSEEHSLYRGLTDLTLVQGTTLIQAETALPVYSPGERVVLRVGVATPTAGRPIPVEVVNGDQTIKLKFTCRQAGTAEWQEVPIPEGFAEDGDQVVQVKAFGKTAKVTVKVDGKRLTACTEQRLMLHRLIGTLSLRPGLAKQTETRMAKARLLEVDRLAAVRKLDELEAKLGPLYEDVRRWLAEKR